MLSDYESVHYCWLIHQCLIVFVVRFLSQRLRMKGAIARVVGLSQSVPISFACGLSSLFRQSAKTIAKLVFGRKLSSASLCCTLKQLPTERCDREVCRPTVKMLRQRSSHYY
jgi:hypothetical protein